jgi:murein DD-endopeptidase MepM/ murein hydrolase activator NlpD
MKRAAAALALALTACPAPRTTVRPPPPPVASSAPTPPPLPAPGSRAPPVPLVAPEQHDEPALEGIVHVVKRGETVYRIARAYGIEPADLMETNGISDPRTIAVGAELFVPGATHAVEVPPAPVPGDPAPAGARAPPPPPASASASAPAHAAAPDSGPTSHEPAPLPDPGPSSHTAAAAPVQPMAARGAAGAPLAWPLKGVLYGRYGVRAGHRHDGIDIAAPEGTTVSAAAAGTVIYAGEQTGYGSIVIVRHDGGLVTLYAHNSRLLVDEGARVRRGEPIARVGQTGRTTGPHLHFEVREGTRPRNPLLYLP